MFLRLEISCVLAVSPRYRALGPNPTRDLFDGVVSLRAEGHGGVAARPGAEVGATYGVARLETSFAICQGIKGQYSCPRGTRET